MTLLEVMLGLTLLGLVLANVYTLFGDSTKAMSAKAAQFDCEVEARRVLDRIAMAVIGAEFESLHVASSAPSSSDTINYALSLGFADGEPVWSGGQRITHQNGHEVTWIESPGEAEERRATWTRDAAQYLEGEVENGVDDNGNGLIDERGLSFDIDGRSVRIRFTISKPGPDGRLTTRTLETQVTCRN